MESLMAVLKVGSVVMVAAAPRSLSWRSTRASLPKYEVTRAVRINCPESKLLIVSHVQCDERC